MFLDLISEDSVYDETFLQNYAKINIIPELQRVNGVGQAVVFGLKDYAVRVWLKPDRLVAYGLSPQEVLAAVREQNLEAAPGRIGENSTEAFEYTIKYKGKFNTPEEFDQIVPAQMGKFERSGARYGHHRLARRHHTHRVYSIGGPGVYCLFPQTIGGRFPSADTTIA